MAKMGVVENGLKRKRKTRRRRNPTIAAKTKNPARRRSISLASAKSVIKKNGMFVTKSVANGRKRHKKHRKHRNGLATISHSRNGFFGNSKSDAKQVLQLGAGALGVKALGGAISGFMNPIFAKIGVGQYSQIITDGLLALFVAPFVGKHIGGTEGAKMMRLGGLLTVALDGVEMFAPNLIGGFSPFNTAPIVMTGAGAAVAPAAVAQLAADVEAGRTSAAKVGHVMRSLDAAGAQSINTGMYNGDAISADDLFVS